MGKKVSSKFKKKVKIYCKDPVPFPENVGHLKTGVICHANAQNQFSVSQNAENSNLNTKTQSNNICMTHFLESGIFDSGVDLVNTVDLLTIEKTIRIQGDDRIKFDDSSFQDTLDDPHVKNEQQRSHFHSLETARRSAESARLAVRNVLEGRWKNAFILHRLSQHHPNPNNDPKKPFLIDSSVVAAHEAIHDLGLQRVLILDLGIRHGASTQQMTYSENQVLYMSLHRYDHGLFAPGSSGGVGHLGEGKGLGFNLNFPFNFDTSMDQTVDDYMYNYAFERGFWPVISEFAPELVIIACSADCTFGNAFGQIHLNGDSKSLHLGVFLTNWFDVHGRKNPKTNHISCRAARGRRQQPQRRFWHGRISLADSQGRVRAESSVPPANV